MGEGIKNNSWINFLLRVDVFRQSSDQVENIKTQNMRSDMGAAAGAHLFQLAEKIKAQNVQLKERASSLVSSASLTRSTAAFGSDTHDARDDAG